MFGQPTALSSLHVTDPFKCGKHQLDYFLRKWALLNQIAGASRTFVLAGRDNRVIAYHTLVTGEVSRSDAPEKVVTGPYQVSVLILARMAVHKSQQGNGFGKAMLKDAIRRCLIVHEHVGFSALLVHAKDEDARAFYEKFGFIQSPTDPLHLFMSIETLEAAK